MMLTADGEIKLVDVCFALALGNAKYKFVANPKGGASYWAPEAFAEGKYSLASDSFSFGSIIYAMAGEGTPLRYKGWTDAMIMGVVASGKRSPISSDCPESLAKLINACWKQDPDLRPTMESLYAELNKLHTEAAAMEDLDDEASFVIFTEQGEVEVVTNALRC